jgi:Carboxypeptidase regulatory-like domain
MLLIGGALPAAALGAGSISGTVRDANGLAPLPNASVQIFRLSEDTPPRWTIAGFAQTAVDGTYTVGNLVEGDYVVQFPSDSRGYFDQYYNGKEDPEEAVPVKVETDQAVANIDALLIRGGRIQGRVTEAATGQPVERVVVCAWNSAGALGNCGITDQAGFYAIFPLRTDQYKVEFWVDEENELLPQFYAGRATMAEADPVAVVQGQAKLGIDAALAAKPRPPSPPVVVPVFSQPPPALTTTTAPPAAKPARRLKCKKGFRKRRVKGKARCVKVKKPRRAAATGR